MQQLTIFSKYKFLIIMLIFLITMNTKCQTTKVLVQYERDYKEKKIWVTDINSGRETRIILPKYVRIKKFSLLKITDKICGIEVETHSIIPIKTKDKILFSVHFSRPRPVYPEYLEPVYPGQPESDLGITCGIGPSPYNSPAPSRFGALQGGIFSRYLPYPGKLSRWIGPLISAEVQGNKITFCFESKFISNKVVRYFIISYTPHRYAVYWNAPRRKLKRILADGIDFEFPDEEEIIHMTVANCIPEP